MSRASDVSPRHDGDLLYLTDTAYSALLDHESGDGWPSKSKNRLDGLFMERLESFIEGQQKEMESFAVREQRPVDEIRRLVAIPHARYIFSLDPSLPRRDEISQASTSNVPSLRSTLGRLSNMLQILHGACGLDSLLLVVSPHLTSPSTTSSTPVISNPEPPHHSSVSSESHEASWIGGTDLGKEFWMGLKGGGVNGARAFRVKCQMRREAEALSLGLHAPSTTTSPDQLHSNTIHTSDADKVPMLKMRSSDVKTELNAAVRHALRLASGNPSAEMRWTKPLSLEESYNVRLIGWPPCVEMRNPSNNNLKDNRLLLDLVRSGKLRFVQKGSAEWNSSRPATQEVTSPSTYDVISRHGSPIVPTSESNSVSSHLSIIDSLKFPALSVEFSEEIQRSSSSPSYNPSSLLYSSCVPTPGMAEGVGDVSPISPIVPFQSNQDISPALGAIAPKRSIEYDVTERQTQAGRQTKRAKLDPRDAAE